MAGRKGIASPTIIERKRRDPLSLNRASITNGNTLFVDKHILETSVWARRYRDLLNAHVSDAGGADNISQAEHTLIRRATMLTLQTELMDTKFAENDGVATPEQLQIYQRITNTLRRTLQTLSRGLGRRPVDVTHDWAQTLAEYRGDHAEAAE